ncbi:MAG: amidohydrolase [Marinilabiliales bacterium]|nr:MAG: amidohydrolase [Marinilabiliales bacterium]
MPEISDLELIVNLRKELHKYPELSGNEKVTSRRIIRFLEELQPDEIVCGIGGYGVAARFSGDSHGRRLLIRAELDALPVTEMNNFDYRSVNTGVSHACGHDGHMAVAAGVAKFFASERPEKGEVVVLFQPSEENGKGAEAVLGDPRFERLMPDFAIAMHNLPGYKKNSVIVRPDVFAMASEGIIIRLEGKTSHAAEPENGLSPARAVSRLLEVLPGIAGSDIFKSFALVTVIHARLGEVAFGTSPGHALVMATLRACADNEMEELSGRAVQLAQSIAGEEGLKCSVSFTERFPATVNDPGLAQMASDTAKELSLEVCDPGDAFRWSEDFGWFTRKTRGLLFGIGAGKGHPELHNPDYDFPDDITSAGINMLTRMSLKILG